MENYMFRKPVMTSQVFKAMALAIMLAACSEPDVTPVAPKEDRGASLTTSKEDAQGRKSCDSKGPNYNLNVLLNDGKKGGAFGMLKFRQYQNETQFIHLDTWVHELEPNTSYLLQRAVDTNLNGDCESASWLTLGFGLDPGPIITDKNGSGSAALYRSVSSIPVGSTFDIHFQIVKESTMQVVLTSDCYQYTIR